MKHKHFFYIFCLCISLCACHSDGINETKPTEENTTQNDTPQQESYSKVLDGSIENPSDEISLDGLKVTTILGEDVIENSKFSVLSEINGKIQFYCVNDGDNVLMMSRLNTRKNEKIEINAYTTTLALVTMYPLFSSVTADDYDEVVRMVTNSPKFEPLQNEVEKAISDRKNIFDESNEVLLRAFSDLIADLCGGVDEENYSGELDILPNQTQTVTKAIYENPRIYPLYAETNRNVLTLRNTGLTPSYYGTVTHSTGVDNISVLSRSDYGGFDLFKTVGEINLGPERNYWFSHEGEYEIYLSRLEPEAIADYYIRIANCLLTSIGVDLGYDAVLEIGNSISRAITNAGSGVHDEVIDPMEWLGIAYNATLEQLKTGTFFRHGVSESLVFVSEFLARSLTWYSRIKGAGNLAVRIGFSLSAPDEIRFCLCYYAGEISTCTEVSLSKKGGDEQHGYANQKLLLPLEVYVSTIEEGTGVSTSSSYHRVKFEVISGGGSVENELVSANSQNVASTYWTLGDEGNQKIKASVVDVITNKEISNPVYFTASIGDADVTIRLDWTRHSGKTDIDLHVVDPYGTRIYYNNMSSSSGGYLDRDDRVGPGPEHIRWSNAPAGTYKIYVHYYPNDDSDKSVVQYTVTVNACGKNFRPKSGAITYDQMVPVGQFTIGENQARGVVSLPCINPGSEDGFDINNMPRK